MGSKAGWLALSVFVFVADQLSKWAAQRFLDPAGSTEVIPGFFALRLAHNTGAAFSLLADAGGWQRGFFVILGLAVSVGIVWWLLRLEARERWTALGLSLVLGGALGNVIDRVRLGYVIDFLDVYYGRWHWPTFNLADSAITVGAVILVLTEVFRKTPGEDKEREGADR